MDHRRHHPSFSSTLLDQIYRSIDDSSSSTNSDVSTAKKTIGNRRKTADDFVRSRNPKTVIQPVYFKHSSSSSSDSSGFSSSESDSFYKSPAISHPKPIRTTVERFEPSSNQQQHSGSFLRTKSKALKMYSDLKKVKQPISPGGRLSTFLNSIFTGAGNTKKSNKIRTSPAVSNPTTTCSSASSFSRSCLSKTPSSSKSKRSVQFCNQYNNKLYGDDERESNRHHQNFEIRVMEENRRVMEAAKELLRTYQKNNDDVVVVNNISGEEEEEDDDDDDAVSCASSDLFELDNLSAIGIDMYREELPVYETTRLKNYRQN